MEKFNKKSNIWFTEYHTQDAGITMQIKDTLYHERSAFQDIKVIDTEEFGRVLLLDNLIMLTERDEFIYHEMITHVPVHINPGLKDILIIGGGDCGTLREITRYDFIESVKMVEIDADVVSVSRNYFPDMYKERPNGEIIIGDGIAFMKEHKGNFDMILVDSTDPIGPAEGLFNVDFYKNCAGKLSDRGMLVIQAESPYYFPEVCSTIYKNLKKAFKYVIPYIAHIPTYPSGMWQFMIASNADMDINIKDKSLSQPFAHRLKYYNHAIHNASFALPNFVKGIYE